jgi:hypothetical protein
MLKRGTLWLMMVAIALGGGVLLFEAKQRGASVEASSEYASDEASDAASGGVPEGATEGEGELIFAFAEADVEGVTVKRADSTLSFSKSADGRWQMTQPQSALAESGAIAFLLSQLTNPTARTLNVEASTLKDFGLDKADTTLTLTAKGSTYQLAVGAADFSGDKLYVRVIEPDASTAKATESAESAEFAADGAAAGLIKVHVVSGGLKNALDRPTAGWLAAVSEPSVSEPASDEPARDSGNPSATPPTTN